MTPKDFEALEDGARVVFKDGIQGTIKKNPNYTHMREISWDDGGWASVRADTPQGREWLLDIDTAPVTE